MQPPEWLEPPSGLRHLRLRPSTASQTVFQSKLWGHALDAPSAVQDFPGSIKTMKRHIIFFSSWVYAASAVSNCWCGFLLLHVPCSLWALCKSCLHFILAGSCWPDPASCRLLGLELLQDLHQTLRSCICGNVIFTGEVQTIQCTPRERRASHQSMSFHSATSAGSRMALARSICHNLTGNRYQSQN